METICIIPARGGSKGIPRKNVLNVAGKPLIAWAIAAAADCKAINRIIVSTDDKEITDVSTRFNAEVIQRPPHISGDNASSEDALLHVLEHLNNNERYQPDTIVFMQCTCPLTKAGDINDAIDFYKKNHADVVFSAVISHAFLWRKNEQGLAKEVNHDPTVRLLRQQRRPQFRETGAFYIINAQGFKQHHHRFFGKTMLYPVSPLNSIDIDEPWQINQAEQLLNQNAKNT